MQDDNIVFISLSNGVKNKIENKFKDNIEEFIEKEFPQDKDLNCYFFKYKGQIDDLIGLKIDNSDYVFLLKRVEKKGYWESYFIAIDIQKRDDIIVDKNNQFLNIETELKIPIMFNRNYEENADRFWKLAKKINNSISNFKPYVASSLTENAEFKKWYAYLTLLEKLIDAKDFYFEADILYSDKKAKVDISDIKDKKLLEKIKKARNQPFLYYDLDIDKSKPLHEWDEKEKRRDNDFGELKGNNNNSLSFDLDDGFIKKFKKTSDKDEIISLSLDDEKFALDARKYIEEKVKSTKQVKNCIEKLELSKEDRDKLITLHSKLSNDFAHYNKDKKSLSDEEKTEINQILILLGGEKSNSFKPPKKLILRVSYFRDQFQLKILKRGLEDIQRHPLKAYLFGDKKIDKIDDEEVKNFEIEYLSKVLNDKQKEAIKKALISKEIFMIQGPPGTGKTEVISELAYQEALRGNKVLITSQANMAVDNALQRLDHPSMYPVRIIRKDYEPEDGDSLPIEANIASCYQDRIISNLSKELKEEQNEFSQIQQDFLDELKDYENEDIEEERNYLSSYYLKNVNIWGATLFETGKHSFKHLNFDTVIVDEVSKAMPPELVLPILKAKKLILVGDHKQLPPIVKDVSLEDLANETGISLASLDFETTVFEKLITNNPDSFVMLNAQYRMHPHIQMAINQFYRDDKDNGGLVCGLDNPDIEKCHKIENEVFKDKHLIWLKTKSSDIEERDGTSFKNQSEINGIRKTLEFLDKAYKKSTIKPAVGVITFYGKQLGELTRIEKRGFWNLPQNKRNFPNLDLRFGTVDRFQGQEKDIIIVSLVRNNKEHNVGFAKKPNRVNVAFSRAKKLLIIVGNVDNFTFGRDEKSSKMYREIFNIAKKFGTVKGIDAI